MSYFYLHECHKFFITQGPKSEVNEKLITRVQMYGKVAYHIFIAVILSKYLSYKQKFLHGKQILMLVVRAFLG